MSRTTISADIECPLVASKGKMDPDGDIALSDEASFCTNDIDTDETSELFAATKTNELEDEEGINRITLYLSICFGCLVMMGVDIAVVVVVVTRS